MTQLNTPNLDQLLGAYLHQDWLDEFEGDEEALRAVIELEPMEHVAGAVEEIEVVLGAALSDEELGKLVVSQMGCYFSPKAIGLTYEAWLERVRRILEQAGKPRQA